MDLEALFRRKLPQNLSDWMRLACDSLWFQTVSILFIYFIIVFLYIYMIIYIYYCNKLHIFLERFDTCVDVGATQ